MNINKYKKHQQLILMNQNIPKMKLFLQFILLLKFNILNYFIIIPIYETYR